jgi:hypothetical protein
VEGGQGGHVQLRLDGAPEAGRWWGTALRGEGGVQLNFVARRLGQRFDARTQAFAHVRGRLLRKGEEAQLPRGQWLPRARAGQQAEGGRQ